MIFLMIFFYVFVNVFFVFFDCFNFFLSHQNQKIHKCIHKFKHKFIFQKIVNSIEKKHKWFSNRKFDHSGNRIEIIKKSFKKRNGKIIFWLLKNVSTIGGIGNI